MTDLATYVAALEQTWHSLAEAVTGLTPEQWAAPTDLPGWSVKDNVSHVAGMEALLLGEPYPDHALPLHLPHVRNDAGRFMEVPVDVRRSRPGEAVLGELRDVTERRLKALRALDEPALDGEVMGFFGRPLPLRHMLGIRTFDCWAHEQDVRRALGLPRTLTAPAADISRRRLLLGLSRLAEDVPAAAGRVVVIETTGVPSVATLRLGDEPSYEEGSADAPDVRVVLDFETFLLLGCGRVAYDAVSSSVTITGDVALGTELVRDFAITP